MANHRTMKIRKNARPVRLMRGRGQVPLRHAVRISLGEAITSKAAHISTLMWGIAFGVISAGYSPPATRPLAFLISMSIAACISYAAMIPWRWRLVPRSTPWFLMIWANGTVSLAMGILMFAHFITGAKFANMGTTAFGLGALRHTMWNSLFGFQFPVIGFYITLGWDYGHREHILGKQADRFEQLATQARLAALRSQINPHFFFNALNTIAALIPTRPADAERAVELMATALRPVLTREQPMTATMRDELLVAQAYADIERLRMGERCSFRFDVSPDAMDWRVPSLALQPLVENAVRHGAALVPGAYEMCIACSVVKDCLQIEIGNRPVNAESEEPVRITPAPGHALHNISERLQILFGSQAILEVWRTGEHSGRCIMRVPRGGPKV